MYFNEYGNRYQAARPVIRPAVDYIQMNSSFLDKAGWTASVNKMINAFGARA